ncbi:hypothetical protein HG15A2_27670 [Adhaeretor mobilis]|uniref:Immunity protein 35 domain-containing protein n=2 Tax=Adhaeretor mobilis TaxID=1930276 RepID=A0A517MX36_9BACT|nr:hypothetical protein HG15A2_27670 [Adhaeretor mobilis]
MRTGGGDMKLHEARRAVEAYLESLGSVEISGELAILDEHTLEVACGWVFFYQSKRFLQTNEIGDALAGNAPILVDSRDDSMHITGTARRVDYYVQNYLDTGDTHVEAVPVLVLSGWRVGAKKVSATRLLNRETNLGLKRSKQCIDHALEGVATRLQLSDFGEAERIRASLDELGWDVSVERDAPNGESIDASA